MANDSNRIPNDGERSAPDLARGARPHSALRAAIDTEISLARDARSGGLAIAYGPSNEGKSFLALDVAKAIKGRW